MLKFIIGLLWVSYIIALKDIDSDHSQYLRSIPDDSKATQTLHSHVFRESLPELANRDDLTQLNIVRHDLIHEVVFVIKQRNIDELTRLLHDISDPLSAKYGEHMTKAEVRLLTSNPESRDAVVAYLKSNGAFVTSETTGGEYISAKGPISLWEKVFNTKFFVFHQMHENVLVGEIVRAEKYWVPRELNLHVDSVFNIIEAPIVMYGNTPAHKFVPEPPKKTRWASKGNSLPLVTPAKLRSYYNVGNAKGSDASTQAIYASLKQYFSPTDVKKFLNSFAPPARDVIVVRNDSSDAKCILDAGNCAESNLDLEYMMGMSQVSPTTSWYTDAPFHYWLMEVANSTSIPLVLSISYGAEEKFVSDSVHDAFTIEAKKLGLMGVTIFAASGDDGANSRLVRTKGPTSCGYISIFPASNPYVTSVGATAVRLLPSLTSFDRNFFSLSLIPYKLILILTAGC